VKGVLASAAAAAALACGGLGGPATAHHSFSTEFTDDVVHTIEGELTRVWWRNPHVRYEVTVANEDGTETVWELQTNATTSLVPIGWTRESLEVGDRVTVEGAGARSGAPKLYVNYIQIEGGERLVARGGGQVNRRTEYATSEPFRANPEAYPVDITGVWNNSFGFRVTVDDLEPKPYPFTEEGRRLYEANQAGHDPALRCVPVGTARTFGGPRGMQIFDAGGFYLFVYEAGDEHRWIFMDGREPPENTPLSYTGFSVGHWEDRELVIETTHLLPVWLDGSGLPMSGEETRLVERWSFNEDGSEASRIMTIHDPLYTEPLVRTRGSKRAEFQIQEESCDPDSFYEDVFERGELGAYFEAVGD
jgi:hypothetical protein